MFISRNTPLQAVRLIIGSLVFVFIALPIGAMLVRSLVVSGPAPVAALHEMTVKALAHIEPDKRRALIDRWSTQASPRHRMEATAAALELNALEVPWDRKAPFDEQIEAAAKVMNGLPVDQKQQVLADLPVSIAMLHKRIPLAFQVKPYLSEDEFVALRTGKHTGYGFDHYLSVLSEQRLRNAAKNSLSLAFISTITITVLAFLLAYGINRGGIWKANIARYGILVPLVSPPVVIATAAILLLGRNGLLTKNLLDDQWGLIDAGVTNIYGFSGVVLAQILSYLPPAFIIFDNVLAKQDGRLEEAAAIQGASFWQTFRHVTLPMAQPGIIRAGTLVFILSMTDFGNPLVIGKDIPVLAGVLYDEMIGFHNTSLSSAIAVWLIVPALCLFAMLSRIGRHKRFETKESFPSLMQLPKAAKNALSRLTWSLIGITGVIYGTILVGAFVRVWGQDFTFTPNHFTSVEVSPGFASGYAGIGPVWTSLKICLVAAPLGGLLAVVIAYLAERMKGWFNEALTFTVLLPAILPGVVFGIGYIVAFNNPLGFKSLSLNGTHAILVLNILFGNMFVGVLAGRAMLKRLDSSVDEAAEILGANLAQRFTRVTLPMMRRAALFGTLYIFIDGMCTFSAVVFLQGPGIDLASAAIFHTASVSYYGLACAMSVSILLIVFVLMGIIAAINRYNHGQGRPSLTQTIEVSP